MKAYTKADIEHVLKEFKAQKDKCTVAGDLVELQAGIIRLHDLLEKDDKEWTFDDYVEFYTVKSYLV